MAESEKMAHAKLDGAEALAAMGRLVAVVCGDVLFVLAGGTYEPKEDLEALAARRSAFYLDALKGTQHPSMVEHFDEWLLEIVRALAPVSPPLWIPMMHVIREKVTLEVGARGLRSLFSNKPSEKDVLRVKRYGALAVRALRAVLAADAPLDPEERTLTQAVVSALGLPAPDAQALSAEPPMPPESLDVYGDIDHAVARAIVRGAWLAAVADGIDPREEHAIDVIAKKVAVHPEDVEQTRREAQERLEARAKAGAAAVDGVRFVLSDRSPGLGVRLAALTGTIMIPRRWRDEALAQVGLGAPVTLASRHLGLDARERFNVLGVVWSAALMDNPNLARRAMLRARWERFAADLGEDDPRPRELVERAVVDVLTEAARSVT